MKYYYKFYLWENGAKSTDYSSYVVAPIFYEERLNEELDTAEVVLDRMPIATKFAFPPKTKFRLEKYKTQGFTDTPKTYDLIVEHDDVEEYMGCPDICCHRISLIEPSAIAQGMHVDNIALTYELQDVTTNYKTYTTDDAPVSIVATNGGATDITGILRETSVEDLSESWVDWTKTYFKNTYAYLWDEDEVANLTALFKNLEVANNHTITFKIPKLYCYGTESGGAWDKKLFQMNTICRVYKYETNNKVIDSSTKTLIIEKKSGPTSIDEADNEWYYSDGETAALRTIDISKVSGTYGLSTCYSTASTIAQIGDYEDDTVTFTTESLGVDDINSGKGYYYAIEIIANPVNQDGMLTHYEGVYTFLWYIGGSGIYVDWGDEVKELADASLIKVTTSFGTYDLSNDTEFGALIAKGVKYSCYELLRKALLTIDTQVIDNSQVGLDTITYPIFLDGNWENRLKTAKVNETILENKNLWEVFIQIGYYLHAIPYLQFATDGTDRLMLSFTQLGKTSKTADTSTKITVFNSQNLNDYFTQYDSYVTNLFSPQNLVEEWLVPTTEDDTTLISNNTAILKTTYGISEIVAFDITYKDFTPEDEDDDGVRDALNYIFEESIYSILSADYNVSPSKADALYYSLGDNKIQGLNYQAPSGSTVIAMALKQIVGKLYSGVTISNVKFNNIMFHIKYRTQDSMRMTQIRPNIEEFMKNSAYEKFPHHEQFYGQQDKIVDSERLSLNLYGKLIRVGNNICQRQEKAEIGEEKSAGDLIVIDNELYYVTETEEEWYQDAIFQKVTYSKNFNQLSQIVTIPSEPRFYEVSERSKIRREVRMFDFFKVSTISNTTSNKPRFLNPDTWKDFIARLIFNKEECVLPNFAWTSFIADELRTHKGSYNQVIETKNLFPSSEYDRTDESNITPKASSNHSDVVVPLLHFPLKDGITFEWDMEDNFKAGDSLDTEISGVAEDGDTTDDAYYALQSVRYVDVFGRADLFNFRLFNKTDWNYDETQSLPKACYEPSESNSQAYVSSDYAIGLDKDCREELSFDYQINLLYTQSEDGAFVTFSNMFGTKDSELYCCLLDGEVSVFNENTKVIANNVLADSYVSNDEDAESKTPTVSYTITADDTNEQIIISFSTTLDSATIAKVKSVVFYEIDDDGNKVSYLAKNFATTLTALPNLYIYPVFAE